MAREFARIRMVCGGNEVDVAAMCDGKVPLFRACLDLGNVVARLGQALTIVIAIKGGA